MKLFILGILLALPASASTPSHETRTAPVRKIDSARTQALARFNQTCIEAFAHSAGTAVSDTPSDLCDCATHEAKESAIPADILTRESAEIARDPKYPIRDPKLLEAFHVCTADAMIEADHDSRAREDAAKKNAH